MLIVASPSQLGDRALNPEESLLKLKEENQALVADRKMCRQDELEDAAMAAGEAMDWRELVRRLSKCNLELMFRDGSAGQIALYRLKTRAERDADEYDFSKPGWYNDFKYATGFPKERLPEFSHVIVDERGLPKREIRGWRSVLLMLVKANAINYRHAVKQFGEPTGRRAWRWMEQTRSERFNG